MALDPSPTSVPDAAATRLVAEHAYTELRDRIVTLHLPPGTALREEELMGELGIGRTPLREAVKRLALENLVDVQPRRGTFVSAVEAADIQNITEVRAELEGYAAELAALRLDPETRATAEALLRDIEGLDEPAAQDQLMRFDERIHRFTWEAARNPHLTQTLERYFTHSLRIWYLVLDRVPTLGHAVHDQTQLLEAILDRNGPHARTIMHEHVLAFQRAILAAFSRT
ncbi:MAG TPA: GntR family transcriptional regulator [Thermoleophilaceae bacterium]|nr:GntR family transcriptional regulator [Thermoleophilaceae bacterium]